jgi:hypothetical protein
MAQQGALGRLASTDTTAFLLTNPQYLFVVTAVLLFAATAMLGVAGGEFAAGFETAPEMDVTTHTTGPDSS